MTLMKMVKEKISMENLDKLKKFLENKKVFITGHTGFKGSWLSIILTCWGQIFMVTL